MKCIRCSCFSSARICWACSQRPDSINYALVEHYKRRAELLEWYLRQIIETENDNILMRGFINAAKDELSSTAAVERSTEQDK